MSLTRIRVCNSFLTCIAGRTSRSVSPDSGEWPSCCQGAPTRTAESRSRVLDLLANPRSPMDLARVHRRLGSMRDDTPTVPKRVPAGFLTIYTNNRDVEGKAVRTETNA